MDVQETGGNDLAGGVHHLGGFSLDIGLDGGDAAVLHADVGLIGRGFGTVHHGTVADDQIIHG